MIELSHEIVAIQYLFSFLCSNYFRDVLMDPKELTNHTWERKKTSHNDNHAFFYSRQKISKNFHFKKYMGNFTLHRYVVNKFPWNFLPRMDQINLKPLKCLKHRNLDTPQLETFRSITLFGFYDKEESSILMAA